MAQVSTSTSVVVEVLADGGIRLTTLAGDTGLASLPATRDWIAEARSRRCGRAPARRRHRAAAGARRRGGAPPRVLARRGAVASRRRGRSGRSSIQTAAYNGLTDQVTRPARAWHLAERRALGGGRRTASRCNAGTPTCWSRCAMPARRPPRPRAAGGAPRRGRAPRLHAALDLVAARAVPRPRRVGACSTAPTRSPRPS